MRYVNPETEEINVLGGEYHGVFVDDDAGYGFFVVEDSEGTTHTPQLFQVQRLRRSIDV